jgi:hypothetical protein
MGCGCGQKTQTSEPVAYEALPNRAEVSRRTFSGDTARADAEMYLATNGGGKTRPVPVPSPAALPNG